MGVRSVSGQGWQQLYVQNVPTYWTEGGYKQISSATGLLHIQPMMELPLNVKRDHNLIENMTW